MQKMTTYFCPLPTPDDPSIDSLFINTWWEDLQSQFSDEERADPANTKSAWIHIYEEYQPISNMKEAENFIQECETKHYFETGLTQLSLITPNYHSKTELERAEIFQKTFLGRHPLK